MESPSVHFLPWLPIVTTLGHQLLFCILSLVSKDEGILLRLSINLTAWATGRNSYFVTELLVYTLASKHCQAFAGFLLATSYWAWSPYSCFLLCFSDLSILWQRTTCNLSFLSWYIHLKTFSSSKSGLNFHKKSTVIFQVVLPLESQERWWPPYWPLPVVQSLASPSPNTLP